METYGNKPILLRIRNKLKALSRKGYIVSKAYVPVEISKKFLND
jgi:hypothetical protein